jgi:hypothetical protein
MVGIGVHGKQRSMPLSDRTRLAARGVSAMAARPMDSVGSAEDEQAPARTPHSIIDIQAW